MVCCPLNESTISLQPGNEALPHLKSSPHGASSTVSLFSEVIAPQNSLKLLEVEQLTESASKMLTLLLL